MTTYMLKKCVDLSFVETNNYKKYKRTKLNGEAFHNLTKQKLKTYT
jgi:hypothetical protein